MLRSLDRSAPVFNCKPIRTGDYSVEIQRSGPATLPAMYHNLHLVTVMLGGESVVVRGGARDGHAVRLATGESSVRPAGPGRQVTWPQGVHCLYVHLHPRLVRRLGGGPAHSLETRSRLGDRVVRDLGFELYRLVQADALDHRAAGDLVLALADHVAASYPASAEPPVPVGVRSLEQVLDRFREGNPASYSVDSVARWCGLSRPYFSRRIRALTGLWPQAMILGSRIEAAKHLLERGDASLSEVAYETGFADQSHLTRALRRSTGLTPACYRASQEFKTRRPAGR
jgi:AraC family transcriptional regulator